MKTRSQGVYTIVGIVKTPSNSSITFDFIVPLSNIPDINYGKGGQDFILVNSSFNKIDVIKKIRDSKEIGWYLKSRNAEIDFIPLESLYFNKSILAEIFSRRGNRKVINTIIIIMLVILIISVLNFSNLQIINTNACIKQSAINMVNGAQKRQVIYQKTIELRNLFFDLFVFLLSG